MENYDLNFTSESIKLLEVVEDRRISNTQSIKTLLIEKDGKDYIALNKWWRKSVRDPWIEGKGFHMEQAEAEDLLKAMKKAILMLK
ncbi:hypothetical protein [Brevibacillus reuszeri]|uniref:hypothetical protein n=1 Tax=Brevibacillus reuszeri TaxID=54915 RepID=UPI003D1FCF1A